MNINIWLLQNRISNTFKTIKEYPINKNTSVNGMINDSCKRNVNFELTDSKQLVITRLQECHYRTPPKTIAQLLEEFFKEWPSKEGHWLFIAQHWNSRAILRTINRLVKLSQTGAASIQNPAAYFTFLVKRRKQRRSLPISMIAVDNILT